MDRKEKVLAYISSPEYIPLKFDELLIVLDVPENDVLEFSKIIKALESEARILKTKKGRYIKAEDVSSGVLECSRNGKFGFVQISDNEEVFIDARDMKSALHGDKVVVKIYKKATESIRAEGKVVKILERSDKPVVGVIRKAAHDCFYVTPDDKRIFARFRINAVNMADAKDNDRVIINITRYDESGKMSGKVLKSLGKSDNLKSFIESIIIENNLKADFDNETIMQAKNVSQEVTDLSGRTDFRDKEIFTIDGETARDFDDAISIEEKDNGNVILGVHIADVSYYVNEGSPIDNEAYMRGTSVYFPDRVIPMLPEKLSNGICSLNPDVDRFAFSVLMEIDKDGNVLSHSLLETVICSKKRMIYEEVNDIFENGVINSDYEPYMNSLSKMIKLAEVLRQKRFKRGAIEFDFPEAKIITDEFSNPVEIMREERGVSNKMIEEFMLLANETVAEYAFWAELPFIYRVHEAPGEDKIEAFRKFISPLGLVLKGKIDKDNPIKPKALEDILKKVKGTPEERSVSKNMLRSLMKAEYNSENIGHFGLAAKYYCHFTSPIRRYPDLVIHRILKEFINGKDISKYEKFVDGAAKNSSDCEQTAELAERDGDDLMKTAFMSNFIGERFLGVVSGITKFGIFVELENGIEGLIRLENMMDDYYVFDEDKMTLTGEIKGKKYCIGDTLDVFNVKCDLTLRQIEFVRCEDMCKEIVKKFTKRPENRRERRKRR